MEAERPYQPPDPTAPACPLTRREQTRNMLLFSANVGMIYLGCAVFYVGITEAALCKKLGATDAISNLPGTTYCLGPLLTVPVAWFFPFIRVLKPVLAA